MTAQAGTSQLADQGQGRCALSGPLTIDSAPWLWKELSTTGLLSGARVADLAAVTDSDSAGLALLMTWKAQCRLQGGELAFLGVPQRLLALAALTDAQQLLVTEG